MTKEILKEKLSEFLTKVLDLFLSIVEGNVNKLVGVHG